MKIDGISETTRELIEELKKIFNTEDFIIGMLTYADNEKDRKALLDFIKKGEDVDLETVTVFAINLSENNK